MVWGYKYNDIYKKEMRMRLWNFVNIHYSDVIMGAIAFQLTGVTNVLFRLRSKKTSKLRVTGLCEGNSPVTGEFPTQRASNAENVSIWWRHHIFIQFPGCRFGGLFYDLEATWHPNLEPSGINYCISCQCVPVSAFNTSKPELNEQHFSDDIFKHIFMNENVKILILNFTGICS